MESWPLFTRLQRLTEDFVTQQELLKTVEDEIKDCDMLGFSYPASHIESVIDNNILLYLACEGAKQFHSKFYVFESNDSTKCQISLLDKSFAKFLQPNFLQLLNDISALNTLFINPDGAFQSRLEFSYVRDLTNFVIDHFYFLKENLPKCMQHLIRAKHIALAHVQANNVSDEMQFLSNIDMSTIEIVNQILVENTPLIFQKCMKPLIESICKEFQDANQSPTFTQSRDARISNCKELLEQLASKIELIFAQWLAEISVQKVFMLKQQNAAQDQPLDFSTMRNLFQSALGHLYFLQTKLRVFDAGDIPNMEKAVRSATEEIIQKHLLYFEQQPMPVIMTKTNICDVQRNRGNSTTKIPISLKIFAVDTLDHLENMKVTVRLRLVNNERAEAIKNSQNKSNLLEESAGKLIDLAKMSSQSSEYIEIRMDRKEDDMTIDGEYISRKFATNLNVAVPDVSRTGRDLEGERLRVEDDRYFFLAVADIGLQDFFDTTIKTYALSNPVFIRTHSKQTIECEAKASWNRFFSENTPYPSNLRETASTIELRHVLEQHFKDWTKVGTKAGHANNSDADALLQLNPSHLDFLVNYLLEYICNKNNIQTPSEIEKIKKQIPLEYLYKEELGDGLPFTFFSWYYKSVQLLLSHPYFRLKWNAGHIEGFIGKAESKKILRERNQAGLFLIRFTQSVEGDFAIDYVRSDGQLGSLKMDIVKVTKEKTTIEQKFLKCIYMKILIGKSFEDACSILYPGIKRTVAFSSPEPPLKNGSYDTEMRFIDAVRVGVSKLTINPKYLHAN